MSSSDLDDFTAPGYSIRENLMDQNLDFISSESIDIDKQAF